MKPLQNSNEGATFIGVLCLSKKIFFFCLAEIHTSRYVLCSWDNMIFLSLAWLFGNLASLAII